MVVVLDHVSRPRHPEKAHRAETPIQRKPDWIRVRAPVSRGYAETRNIVREHRLVTVCEEAGCPNIGECWEKKHATFMIMGDTCTRACAFCNVKTGLPGALDPGEQAKRARGPGPIVPVFSIREKAKNIGPRFRGDDRSEVKPAGSPAR